MRRLEAYANANASKLRYKALLVHILLATLSFLAMAASDNIRIKKLKMSIKT